MSKENSKVLNFSLVKHPKSCVRVYSDGCMGCQSTGADIMLTFGSTISPLDGNNQEVGVEYPKHVDVFLTKAQAEGLLKELTKALMDNCFIK
jgi:hypothetical protein